jgi:hypothetical protein
MTEYFYISLFKGDKKITDFKQKSGIKDEPTSMYCRYNNHL